jgi:hypothetical protein
VIVEYVAASLAYHKAAKAKVDHDAEVTRVAAAYKACTPRERTEAQRRLADAERGR